MCENSINIFFTQKVNYTKRPTPFFLMPVITVASASTNFPVSPSCLCSKRFFSSRILIACVSPHTLYFLFWNLNVTTTVCYWFFVVHYFSCRCVKVNKSHHMTNLLGGRANGNQIKYLIIPHHGLFELLATDR